MLQEWTVDESGFPNGIYPHNLTPTDHAALPFFTTTTNLLIRS
jgi:hypothetical protein